MVIIIMEGYCIRNGIHYVNFKGILNGDKNHFAVATINVLDNTIIIDGYGDKTDRILEIMR